LSGIMRQTGVRWVWLTGVNVRLDRFDERGTSLNRVPGRSALLCGFWLPDPVRRRSQQATTSTLPTVPSGRTTREQDCSLDLCPHRIGRVLRLHFAKRLGQEHAIARAIRTAAGPATKAFTDT
jgi:hypothetical protein